MSFARNYEVKERRTVAGAGGKPLSYYVPRPLAEAPGLEELILVLATKVGTDALGRLAERLADLHEGAVILELKAKHAIAAAEFGTDELQLVRVDGAHAACGPHDSDSDDDADLPDTDLADDADAEPYRVDGGPVS